MQWQPVTVKRVGCSTLSSSCFAAAARADGGVAGSLGLRGGPGTVTLIDHGSESANYHDESSMILCTRHCIYPVLTDLQGRTSITRLWSTFLDIGTARQNQATLVAGLNPNKMVGFASHKGHQVPLHLTSNGRWDQ